MTHLTHEMARPEQLLNTSEAASVLAVSKRTLEDWRLSGGGPTYIKLGGRLVRYAPTALAEFVAARARINTGHA